MSAVKSAAEGAKYQRTAPYVPLLDKNVRIYEFVNLYGCEIGDDTRIGTFVEIQKKPRSEEIARFPHIPSNVTE